MIEDFMQSSASSSIMGWNTNRKEGDFSYSVTQGCLELGQTIIEQLFFVYQELFGGKKKKRKEIKNNFPILPGNFETMVSRQVSIPSFITTAGSSEHCTLQNKTIKIAI